METSNNKCRAKNDKQKGRKGSDELRDGVYRYMRTLNSRVELFRSVNVRERPTPKEIKPKKKRKYKETYLNKIVFYKFDIQHPFPTKCNFVLHSLE